MSINVYLYQIDKDEPKLKKLKSVQAKKGQNVPKDVTTGIKDCQEALKNYDIRNRFYAPKYVFQSKITSCTSASLKTYLDLINRFFSVWRLVSNKT